MINWAHPIRAVAFDMDGLMVNTEDLYTEVGETILRRRGHTFTRELKKSMMGLPGPQAFGVMIAKHDLADTASQLAEETDEIFVELLPSKLKTLPGLENLLEHLDRLATPRCIATSSTHHFVRSVLDIIDMHDRFDFVVTAQDVTSGKPSPDIYLEAARRLGVAPQELLVLEDSHHGTRAGLAAGACTIAVPGEHSRDQDFSGVFCLAHSLKDPRIVDVLGGAGN